MASEYNYDNKTELEKFLNEVSEVILQQNISLFIGAGSSALYNVMDWNGLIDQISNGCNHWNNLDRAQYAELSGIQVKERIANMMSSMPIDVQRQNTYLNYLLDFNFNSIWTTNYDNIIENVIKNKSKSYIPVYNYNHFKHLSYPDSHFLFKINGSCEDANSIIITHNDFIDYRKTHEAYLILLKRELLCNSLLFLGCSFDDDILRMCVKDILNCINNNSESYSVKHFAVIADADANKLDYISKDLVKHYNISCLKVNNVCTAYKIARGIAYKVKSLSIFISGAKTFIRHSEEEEFAIQLCRDFISSFIKIGDHTFKIISGMGISIGHFISGTVKKLCQGKNLNRYLQMEPFPFTNEKENENHRIQMMNKAGIFLFIYGDFHGDITTIEKSGMWKEYKLAKKNKSNILIPLPCGEDSISYYIYKKEKKDNTSFSFFNKDFIDTFNYKQSNSVFFDELKKKIYYTTRKYMDDILDDILA